MSKLKELFNKNAVKQQFTSNSPKSSNDFIVNQDLESTELLTLKSKELNNFKFNIDYMTGSNFARFGSAYDYYSDSINHILEFPYDSSNQEVQEWRNKSTDLDKFLYDEQWPRTKGFLNFNQTTYSSASVTTLAGFRSSNIYDYVYAGSGYGANAKYDVTDKKNNSFNLSFEDGFTIELWAKLTDWATTTKQGFFTIVDETQNSTRVSVCYDLTNNRYGLSYYNGGQKTTSPDLAGFSYTSSSLTAGTVTSFHHYSFVFTETKMTIYLDGVYDGEITLTLSSGTKQLFNDATDNDFKLFIGCNRILSSTNRVWGRMLGSIDEFRIWKQARTEKQINDYKNKNVFGNTKYDLTSYLSLYYKFNEPNEAGTTIVDYSGRSCNALLLNEGGNALSERKTYVNSPLSDELGDVIIYDDNAEFLSFKEDLLQIGLDHDSQNGLTLFQRMPAWIIEDDQNSSGELRKLTQIMASFLDTLYIQIDSLKRIKENQYEDYGNEEFYKFAINNLGFPAIDIFDNASIINTFLNQDENITFEENLQYVKTKIYQNIYNNLSNIYKSKGTESSIRQIINTLGSPDNLYNLSYYSDNDLEVKDDQYENHYENTKFFNFNRIGYTDLYFYNETNTITTDYFYDFQSSIKFIIPKDTELTSTSSSILRVQSPDVCLYHVLYSRNPYNLDEGKFIVNYLIEADSYSLETEYIKGLTNNSFIDLSVYFSRNDKFSNITYPNFINLDITINGSQPLQYSSSLSSIDTSYLDLFTSSLKPYIGSYYSDTSATPTDILVSNYNFSFVNSVKTKEVTTWGIADPQHENFLDEYNRFNQLFLNYDFGDYVAEGGFFVYNKASNAFRGYEQTNEGTNYPVLADDYIQFLGDITGEGDYVIYKINKFKKSIPGEYSSLNDIKIIEQDDEFFTKTSRPTNIFLSIERSFYRTMSDRMLKVFASIEDYSSIYAQYIDLFREENKTLIRLREMLFKTFQNDIDVEKYQEYYKWFDINLEQCLENIIPASANAKKTISNIIESHVFETNRVRRYLLPGAKPKDLNLSALLSGEKKLKAEYKYEKYSDNLLYSKNWWKYRAERNNSLISSSVAGINDARTVFLSASVSARNLLSPFNINASINKDLSTGVNYPKNTFIVKDEQAYTGNDLLNDGNTKYFIEPATLDDVISREHTKINVLNAFTATLPNGKVYNQKRFDPFQFDNDISGVFKNNTYFSRNAIYEVGTLMSPYTERFNNRKYTQNYLLTDDENDAVFLKINPKTVYTTISKIETPSNEFVEKYLPEDYGKLYSLKNIKNSITRINNLNQTEERYKFGNYWNTRELIQVGDSNDNNSGMKRALFTAATQEIINSITQSVIPLRTPTLEYRLEVIEDASRNFVEYPLFTQTTKETTYKSLFSAPGDSWDSAFKRTIYTSPYSTVNYRNFVANRDLIAKYALPSLFGGIESGSIASGSIHKTYRNSNSSSYYYEYNRNNIHYSIMNPDLTRCKYDNFFVQHAIPGNSRRYSDLVQFDNSLRVINQVYNVDLYKNIIVGNFVGFINTAQYFYGQEGGLYATSTIIFPTTTNRFYDTVVRIDPNFSTRVTSIDTTSTGDSLLGRYYDFALTAWRNGYFNTYFMKLGAPKWTSWKQLRSSDNQIFDYMKKHNLVTKQTIRRTFDSRGNTEDVTYTDSLEFISQSFINFNNHDYEAKVSYMSYDFLTSKEEEKEAIIQFEKPYKYVNSNIRELLKLKIDNLSNEYLLNSNKHIKLKSFRYMQPLYPRDEFVGLNNIRSKPEFTQTDEALLRQFNRRTFWRDDYSNRLIANMTSSQGKIFDNSSVYALEGKNLSGTFEVGELMLCLGDAPDYTLKPYIQYLPPSTFIKFAGITYNRNVNSIIENNTKKPYYDTYENYSYEMKKYLGYSTIPEYNVSEQSGALNGEIENSLNIQNSGTIFENSNFYNYVTTNQIIANNPVKAKIKTSAIKKLNPYNGFYPSDYSLKLAQAFSSSYSDCFSGTYYEATDEFSGLNTGSIVDASPLSVKDVGYIGALKSLFGSGLFFNSLKAGMGYDYSLASNDLESQSANIVLLYNSAADQSYGCYNSRNIFNRLKFNDIYSDSIFKENVIYTENDACSDDLTIQPIKMINYSFVKKPSNKTFNKKINNFLAQTEDFFIEKQKIISKQQNMYTLQSGSQYSMNIKIVKTEDYYNCFGVTGSGGTSYRGSIFGPPHIFYEEAPLYEVGFGPSAIYYSIIMSGSDIEAQAAIDPSFMPYTPSYYYNNTSMQINLLAEKSNYTLDEILYSSSFVHNNDTTNEYWSNILNTQSSANLNKTKVSHMLDIQNKKYLESYGKFGNIKTQDENTTNPSWEIKTKFESPLLYYGDSSNFPSGGGMWMDYGAYSEDKGVYISLSDVSGSLSLADAVGFKKGDYKVGQLKQQKEIEECIVLIPVDKDGNKLFTSIGKDEREQMMDKYVFPSNLDWTYNQKIRPFIFHSFEFSSVLSRDDLADIWQGLMPSLSTKMEEDFKELDIDLTDIEKEQIKKGLTYIVFKVKKRAKYDFEKYRNDEKDEQRYSYNWPYDYCSLVEMCKIDIEIEEEV